MTTTPVAKAKLAGLDSAALIEQYNEATSRNIVSVRGGTRQARINYIVDLLSERDDDDVNAWYAQR